MSLFFGEGENDKAQIITTPATKAAISSVKTHGQQLFSYSTHHKAHQHCKLESASVAACKHICESFTLPEINTID